MRVLAFLPAALLLVACSDPTENGGTVRYELESMYGQRPPVAFGPAHALEPGVLCIDSVYSHVILLTPPSSLQMTVVQAQRCDDGRPRKLVGGSWDGSYTIAGDSIHVTQHVASPLLATTSWSASTANNRLAIGIRRYIESNPLDTMAYIIYRKR